MYSAVKQRREKQAMRDGGADRCSGGNFLPFMTCARQLTSTWSCLISIWERKRKLEAKSDFRFERKNIIMMNRCGRNIDYLRFP